MINFLVSISAFCIGIAGLLYMKRGAIFVPTDKKAINEMVRLLEPHVLDRSVDLGSGDGRIVIALAQAGAEAHGFEHNRFLAWWSRRAIKSSGLSDRAFIHVSNFWNIDFSGFSIITVFGIPYIMRRLEKKLEKEIAPGTRIISYTFPLPNWKPVFHGNGIYLYER